MLDIFLTCEPFAHPSFTSIESVLVSLAGIVSWWVQPGVESPNIVVPLFATNFTTILDGFVFFICIEAYSKTSAKSFVISSRMREVPPVLVFSMVNLSVAIFSII